MIFGQGPTENGGSRRSRSLPSSSRKPRVGLTFGAKAKTIICMSVRCGLALVAVLVAGVVLAGCGGSGGQTSSPTTTSQPSPPAKTKPTLLSNFNLTVVGLAIDDLRSATNRILDKTPSCVQLGQSGDSTGQLLCFRDAQNPWKKSVLVAGNSVAAAYKRAHGTCKVQLGTVLKSIEATINPAVRAVRAIAQQSDTTVVSPLLDSLDRALNRIDAAFARAQSACGG